MGAIINPVAAAPITAVNMAALAPVMTDGRAMIVAMIILPAVIIMRLGKGAGGAGQKRGGGDQAGEFFFMRFLLAKACEESNARAMNSA
jgi:hypothetical protein